PLVLLQAMAEVPEEPLRLGLTHLQAAEFGYETRLFPAIEYTFKHALTQSAGDRLLRADRGGPRRDAGPRALRTPYAAYRVLSCLPRPVLCRAGDVRRGQCPWRRRAPDCWGGCTSWESHAGLVGGWSPGPPPRRPPQGTPLARTRYGHLSGSGPPAPFAPDGCSLRCGVYPGRTHRRRHATAHAGDGSGDYKGHNSLSGAL